MSDDSSFSESPSFAPKNVHKSHFVGVFFLILFVVIVMLVGLYFFGVSRKGISQQQGRPTAAPTQKVAVTPTPTQTPTSTPVAVNRSSIKISVLNGSGVPGAAQGISTKLTGLGYTIKTVGNADRFDYQDVTVKVKKAQSAYGDLLKKDLTDKQTTVVVVSDETIASDAEVIVGK